MCLELFALRTKCWKHNSRAGLFNGLEKIRAVAKPQEKHVRRPILVSICTHRRLGEAKTEIKKISFVIFLSCGIRQPCCRLACECNVDSPPWATAIKKPCGGNYIQQYYFIRNASERSRDSQRIDSLHCLVEQQKLYNSSIIMQLFQQIDFGVSKVTIPHRRTFQISSLCWWWMNDLIFSNTSCTVTDVCEW